MEILEEGDWTNEEILEKEQDWMDIKHTRCKLNELGANNTVPPAGHKNVGGETPEKYSMLTCLQK